MEIEAANLQKIFKALAAFFVFLISFSIPVLFCINVEREARNTRIRMDMGQIRNWAEVYELKNKTYEGFENDSELARAMEDIRSMGGEASVFVAEDHGSYCVKVIFKEGSFCIDSRGYIGKDAGRCSSIETRCD